MPAHHTPLKNRVLELHLTFIALIAVANIFWGVLIQAVYDSAADHFQS